MIANFVVLSFALGADPITQSTEAANLCDFSGALLKLNDAEEFQKGSPELEVIRVRLLIQLEQGEEARKTLSKIGRTSESHTEAEWLILSALAYATSGRPVEAEREIRQARLRGADPDLLDGILARIRIETRRYDDAEKLFRALLSRKNSHQMTGALYNFAVLRALQGNDFEAAGLLRLAWHLGYRNPRKIRSEKAFARIVASNRMVDDLVMDEAAARCVTW